jgi:GxxExxY protein
MGCSICGDPDHNKTKCSKRSRNNSIVGVQIPVTPEVIEKFKVLASLCQNVARELGKGHTEKIYQEALSLELQRMGVVHIMEQAIPIIYRDTQLGGNHTMRIDISLQTYLKFIYELKATPTAIKPSEQWQLVRYLKATSYDYGAVVNFNQSLIAGLEIQFIVKSEGEYYMFDPRTMVGIPLIDYTMDVTIDFSPKLDEVA